MQDSLTALSVLSTLYWCVVAFAIVRLIQKIPLVEDLTPAEPKRWPRVSVIIPACNEEDTLEMALRSRLAEGYPDAEYIVIDDRSTDRTGEIVDRIAAEDSRVVALHVKVLPSGWLGKVHAMHVALERATGAFVLFSDADVHHQPGTLTRIVAHCEEHAIDHVAVFPSVWRTTFGVDVVMNAFLRIFSVTSRAWKASDPRSRVSVGGGNFNLVRRTAFDRAGGLAPLRLEVIDDAGLGQAMKWSGARQAILNARGFVGLWYYRSVSEAVRGMEKNGFAAVGRFSVARLAIVLGLFMTCELGALVAVLGAEGWPRALAAVAIAIALAAQLAIGRWLGRPALPSLFAPLGVLVFAVAALRSTLFAVARGGVDWRGTRYPLDVLRRGMRFELR